MAGPALDVFGLAAGPGYLVGAGLVQPDATMLQSLRIQNTKNPGTKAIVLGVGSPVIGPNRSATSVGIVAGGRLYVFDAGPGLDRRVLERRLCF